MSGIARKPFRQGHPRASVDSHLARARAVSAQAIVSGSSPKTRMSSASPSWPVPDRADINKENVAPAEHSGAVQSFVELLQRACAESHDGRVTAPGLRR